MISIVITTYGEQSWRSLAWERAYPSTENLGAREVIVHHEPELSIGPARNAAAALTSGEWLCFLDADDELDPNYVLRMERAIQRANNPRALFQPSVCYVKNGRFGPARLIPARDLRKDNYLVLGTVLRRELFFEVGGFEDYPHGFEDWSLWAKCWKAGAQVVPVRGAIYIAHVNLQSKHRLLWRDRAAQYAAHARIEEELFG